jgi:hypothetical protein
MGITCGLALLTISKHNRLFGLLIIKEFLNDRHTRQQKAMVLWADVGQISETLFDHPDIIQ